jgi:membrane protease subunit (stomatin/prohibitin family)
LATVLAEIDTVTGALKPAAKAAASKPAADAKSAAVATASRETPANVCPHCGATMPKPMKFCGECGKAMS